ncbi:ATP-binding protein [Paenibacillus popilliae]|uniref:Transposase and inactivated derivative n=1 Tax=Paenibacillus popilliae ATCC 14706 TaxID=1212764 RepID=M9LCM2_PAEPP|nr:ATP-binding protein [Paenibacillus popilliae]GAC43912.1 transposase and inactivated derivative [Paenibacillus popilliae ATCC 14706]
MVHVEKHGERQLTEGFQRFCAHYRMEAVFCNPYSGHEKGHVESKCGYTKRNWAVPIPAYQSQEQLAATLAEQARQDRERAHYAKGERIPDLWEADRRELLTLPETSYEAFRMRTDLAELCRQLRLAHVVEYVTQHQDEQMNERVERLLLAEREGRRRAKLGKLVQQAGFPHLKTFDGYVDTHITFPGESTLELLREMAWLKRKENLLLMGAVGTGKTHMATALGIEA